MILWQALTVRGRWVGALALVLGVAGTSWSYPLVGALGLVLGALVVVELIAVLTSRDLAVHRTVSPLVVVRQGPCEGHLTLSGRRRQGLMRADVAEQVDGELVPIDLPARRTGDATVSYPIPTRRRGVLDVGPVHVRRSSLAGMAARASEVGEVVEVRVLPRIVPLTSMAMGHRRALTGGDDSAELGGTDLVGLHEYTMGDDLRRLHWATSARTGTLMVREDADPAEPHVCVVLDDRAASYADRADDFEDAVEVAAALCRVSVERGHPVRFRSLSGRDEIVVPGSASRLPRREARDIDWLLTEIDTVDDDRIGHLGRRDLDVLVAVTGHAGDVRDLSRHLEGAEDTVVCVVDPQPTVAAGREAGLLVLRGRTSLDLARLWDTAVAR
ncbi:DUF58 domain-containing protein [Nocardioides currus]|uniref:DUF58 domain-containing protein n=1 Tax=Nocardioides currus TaxID=2133958 RepID=A0A2R7YX41_9ACTN|nr:DUF58 domain-containing protein [Nocardioides currus]PUA80945.1 DUF58 domain-containing protein [Nocardioides currus]